MILSQSDGNNKRQHREKLSSKFLFTLPALWGWRNEDEAGKEKENGDKTPANNNKNTASAIFMKACKTSSQSCILYNGILLLRNGMGAQKQLLTRPSHSLTQKEENDLFCLMFIY